jgi:hypothetical protein
MHYAGASRLATPAVVSASCYDAPAFAPTMDKQSMIEEIRELFQNFIGPQLESIKGELKGVDSKITSVDWKIESLRRELLAEIRAALK